MNQSGPTSRSTRCGPGLMVGASILALLSVGCATNDIRSNAVTLVLADPEANAQYSLTVVRGAMVLTPLSGTVAPSASGLTDTASGIAYTLAVDQGTLSLIPESTSAQADIPLTDTVTAKPYALAVSNGALTLTAL